MEKEAIAVSIRSVGMDVHKDSVDVATADEGPRAESRPLGNLDIVIGAVGMEPKDSKSTDLRPLSKGSPATNTWLEVSNLRISA